LPTGCTFATRAFDLRDVRPQTFKDIGLAHGIRETRKLPQERPLFGLPE
jgi:hypothetical protein